MKAGKLSGPVLSRSVLKQLHSRNDRTLIGPGYGMDAAMISMEAEEAAVLSADTITLSGVHAGQRAAGHALNNVAAAGAEPIGILASVILPTDSNETELRAIIKEMDMVCAEHGAQLLGGHTQVSRAVKEPLLSVTGVGAAKERKAVPAADVKPGMDIIVTKWVGLEGSAIIAAEKERELRTRYSQPFIDKAQAFITQLSVVPEAAVAVKSGVSAMHDVSEGGIFGALWEMAEASGVGLEIDIKKIPIRQETIEICEFYDVNPYKLMSGGAMLMAAADGNTLLRALEKAKIPAAVIGKATDGKDRILFCDGERRFLETAQTDELYHVY